MKKTKIWSLALALLLGLSTGAWAVRIREFPGLQKVIDQSDAIVVIRIDEHVDTRKTPNLTTVHSCHVYQTLKGAVPTGEPITLRLLDTQTELETPFALGSCHLVFLAESDGKPAAFQTLQVQGANIRLSPLGREVAPPGDDTLEKVQGLIRGAIEYREETATKAKQRLTKLLR